MSILASGGKTWSIPKSSDTTTNLNSSYKEEFKLFLIGLGMIYCIFLVATIAAIILSLATGGIFNAKSYIINPQEGFTLQNRNDYISFSPITLILVILVPIIINSLLVLIDQKTDLLVKTKNFYKVIGVFFVILVFTALATFQSVNLSFSPTTNTDQAREWMKARYNFVPLQLQNVQDAIDGQFMYSDDPKFPAHDVYLKENNGAYYLYDSAGKELPTE